MRNMCKVNNISIRHRSGVFIVNFRCYSSALFAGFKHVIGGWNALLP